MRYRHRTTATMINTIFTTVLAGASAIATPAKVRDASDPEGAGSDPADRHTDAMIVDCAVYERGRREAGQLTLEEASRACHRDGAFVWLGLHEPSPQEFDAVKREFGLHPLAVEDAV